MGIRGRCKMRAAVRCEIICILIDVGVVDIEMIEERYDLDKRVTVSCEDLLKRFRRPIYRDRQKNVSREWESTRDARLGAFDIDGQVSR